MSSSSSPFARQLKYKEDGKKEMSISLYSVLPDTLDTQHAKEQSDSHSQVPSFVAWEPVISAGVQTYGPSLVPLPVLSR